MKSKRFEVLAARPVNQDGYVQEWPEVGLIAMNSPFDPKPSIKIENGVITEMDGKCRADFDMLDTFIADHAIRLGNAEKAMAMDSLEIARKIVDINVSREEILDITLSLTPAKLTEVVGKLNIVEIMMGMTKMRARIMPANQCHVTNLRDNPVQIAADAAEAGVRGFAEMETTVAVARYAPFNAMALFVGAQVGRPGVMTQCALEEATELQLGMRGFTTYAETISVYGTARLHGRRRHPLLQGVPGQLLRQPRPEDALYLRHRLREVRSLLYRARACCTWRPAAWLSPRAPACRVRRTAPCPASACPPAYPAASAPWPLRT